MPYRLQRLGDGQEIEYHVSGPANAGDLLVFHVGTPSAAIGYRSLAAAAGQLGMRTVTYSRPGYSRSGRQPGSRVADQARVTAAIADHLGHASFFTAGWSGGGPAALACAALLPDRVRACLVLAGLAPPIEVGSDWWTWFAEADAAEYRVLQTPERETLIPVFEEARAELANVSPSSFAATSGMPKVDSATLRHIHDLGRPLARSMRRGVAAGVWGWFDDSVALVGDWGFSVRAIRVPVVIRHGALDANVDVRHGRWLGSAIPGARLQILPSDGHISVVHPFEAVLAILAEAAIIRRP